MNKSLRIHHERSQSAIIGEGRETKAHGFTRPARRLLYNNNLGYHRDGCQKYRGAM